MRLGNPGLVPVTPTMAVAARAARSRQVAECAAYVLTVLRHLVTDVAQLVPHIRQHRSGAYTMPFCGQGAAGWVVEDDGVGHEERPALRSDQRMLGAPVTELTREALDAAVDHERLEHTVTVLSGDMPLKEMLANFADGPDKRAMLLALAQYPAAVSLKCSCRPDRSVSAVMVGLGNPEVQITLTVGGNGGLPGTSKSAVPEIKLTKVQLLSAIKAAVRTFQDDDSVSPATKTLLLALAAYAMAGLDVQGQTEDRSPS